MPSSRPDECRFRCALNFAGAIIYAVALCYGAAMAQTSPPGNNAKPTGTDADGPAAAPHATAEIFPGTGNLLGVLPKPPAAPASSEPANVTFNFVNADIRDVAKVVIGDYLKASFDIAANVQGAITLQTSSPLTHSQILPVLEQALLISNMGIVERDGVYRITAIDDARSASGAARISNGDSQRLGYGVEIIPIHFINAADLQKLIEPLAPAQGLIHVDAVRNILIIEGTSEERQTLLDNIALFDTDWLAGMSFALYTPKYSDVQELGKELTQILGTLTASGSNVLRLVPITRLNAILAVSTQREYLDRIADWVDRLDRPGAGTDRRLFVYRVQNGRASDLASTLMRVMFGGRDPGATAPGAHDAGAPQTPLPVENAQASALTPFASGVANAGVRLSAIGAANITADDTNNALVILASPQEYASIEAALQQLDVVPIQVFLEAAIAEVTLNKGLQYGVQYYFEKGNSQVVLSSGTSGTIGASYPGFSYIFSGGAGFHAVLDALSDVTHVEMISSPKLLVLNNQTASLQVGDRVPVVTQQATSVLTSQAPVLNSVQYQDTGVILKVTPRVNRGGIVLMDVAQEVSDVTVTTTSAIDSPTIEQRKVSTSVAVQDGDTVVLGGLISENNKKDKSGIPLLQSIPVFGNLFSTTDNESDRTELLVFITPHVIDTLQRSRAITEELRQKLPVLEDLRKRGDGLAAAPK